MKKCLFIVGAGIEQVRAYELAREMGLEVVGSDIDPSAPALKLADHKIIASTRDISATVKAARDFNGLHRIDGVMTLANDVPLTVASVAAELGLPSISVDSARIASDKLAMKERFRGDGVPVPLFREITSHEELSEFARECSYPVVIKPNDGRGSRGVLRVTEGVDHEWAFNHALENSESERVLAEKFIDGMQLSTESMVYSGRCYTASVSERNYEHIDRYAPYIIENGGVLPADLNESDVKAVEDVVAAAAASMGIENGPVKGDIVLSDAGPVVIELAARLSGGYLCTDLIPLARGVDLVRQTIKLSLGTELQPSDLVPRELCKMGIRYFFQEPGRIVRITGFDELSRYDWVSKKMLFMGVGDIVKAPTNHTKRVGFVHVTAASFREAEERAIFARDMVRIETVPA